MPYKKTGDGGNGGGAAPSDMDDFIFSKWGPFAGDQGFVSNQAPVPGSAPDREFWTHQGTVGTPLDPFIYLRTKDDQLFLFTGHTSIDISGSEELFDQPNNPCNAPQTTSYLSDSANLNTLRDCPVVNNADGPWTGHHLFSNNAGEYIHAVCQIGARKWRHFLTGILPDANKAGTWVGGTYILGHAWNPIATSIDVPYTTTHEFLGSSRRGAQQGCGFIHCEGLVTGVEWLCPNHSSNNDSPTLNESKAVGGVNNSNFPLGHCIITQYGSSNTGNALWQIGKSLISSATPLLPLEIWAMYNRGGSNGYCYIGTIPDIFRVNMRDLTPGDTITIGTDDYVVFPFVNSNTVDTQQNEEYSGYEGLAYRIIT